MKMVKNMYKLIKKDLKTKLILSKLDVSKSVEPDKIHLKILKYLSSNESFTNAISKLFEKCKESAMIPYIWKIAINKKFEYI